MFSLYCPTKYLSQNKWWGLQFTPLQIIIFPENGVESKHYSQFTPNEYTAGLWYCIKTGENCALIKPIKQGPN